MPYPEFKEFSRLARSATLVPVVKSVSADLLTPVSAFLSIAENEPHAFLLESVERGEQIGRYTFLGARPYMRLRARGSAIEIERGRHRERHQGNVFEFVKLLLSEHQPAAVPGLPPFTAGAVGYFSYDVVRQLEKIGEHAKDDLSLPDCELMFFDRLLAFDHLRHQIHIVAAADVSRESPRSAYDRAVRDIAALERKLAAGLRPAMWRKSVKAKPGKLKIHAGTTRAQFLRSVERCKEYIAAGDIFQVVLSQRLDFIPGIEPFDLYRALRQVNPSPYLYFLRMGDTQILGSSPEMLVRVTGRKLEYRPIAGTHPRGRDEAEDQRLEQQMRNDEKERAEHVMLVDLGRNDLGRVSEYGSVKVKDLMYVERYSHVMHLVSALEGTLRKDLGALDAFAACFPAGTLSGAPKVRAMQIIEELEPVRRGIYGGSVLYADFAGNLDSCIGIRTMLMQGKHAYLQAGAGIVADSDPAKEFEESMNKAQALLTSGGDGEGQWSVISGTYVVQKILHQLLSRIRQHALGMKLHSFDGELSVAQSHDRAGSIFFRSPGADFQFCRQIFLFHDERVIARSRHGHGQAVEDGFVVVRDRAGLAVHQVRSAHDVAAKSRADSLMSQADAEHRHFAGEVPDQINADAGILRRTRSRRDHDALRLHRLDLSNRDLVVAANLNLRAQFPEILNQVVGKGIVVVENEDHGHHPCYSLAGTGHPRPQGWY